MPAEPVIEVGDLRVVAGGRVILEIAQLDVPGGELLAVMGPNGAGKTTLLRTMAGLLRPAAGRVCVQGDDLVGAGPWRATRLRRRIGYVPQLLAAHSEMPLTVREIAAIGRSGLRGLGRRLTAEDWRTVDRWLDRLDLAALADHSYADLSGGQQRRALIARAMVQEPAVLLLDEPTANLDVRFREQVVRTLDELHREVDLAVVLVCHELEVLPAATQRVVLLDGGRRIADGPPDNVLTDSSVERLYGTAMQVVSHGRRRAAVPREAGC